MKHYNQYISADPHICHGQPCFKGTRIMVYLVLELLRSGLTPEAIIKSYYRKLTVKHIQAALHYATDLVKTGESVSFSGV